MKFSYPRPLFTILTLLILSFLFSCSEDYLLKDNEAIYAVNATAKTNNVTLIPIQDAHLTGKTRYNLPIVGVSENKRVAYLMFDLSKIDGEITSATLQITVKENPDTRKDNPGHGITRVFTGSNSNWSEGNLSINNQPKNDRHLGDIRTTYTIGSTQSIKLNVARITDAKTTLILSHKDGKGYTFSSRETSNPPRLILTTTSGTTAKSQIGATKLSSDVLYWKGLFDKTWASPGVKGKSDAMKYATSNGANQEYYYLAWHLDGLIQIWQATGDNKYLNDAIQLIQHTINNAVPVHKGKYRGWPATKHGRVPDGYPLWDSYLYKHVASLLRIMYKSPNLRTMNYGNGSYQDWYDKTLAFVEKNIWEKWYNDNPRNLYRSTTHMASHWARIGMELYVITGKQQYLNVFNNISYAGFPKGMQGPAGSSLRKQIFKNGNSILWYSKWGGKNIQDTSHGADVVSFWVTAHENKMYWSANDMKGLASTLNDVIWKSNSPIAFSYNVNGSGSLTNTRASFHNFITLGRFDQELQNRIKKYYNPFSMKHRTGQAMGIAALNQKIIEDGRPVYPEQY